MRFKRSNVRYAMLLSFVLHVSLTVQQGKPAYPDGHSVLPGYTDLDGLAQDITRSRSRGELPSHARV